jgi:hypothetical protein
MQRIFQRLTAVDNAARLANRERLRELASTQGESVELFCAHDPWSLERARDRPPPLDAATG